MFLKLQACWHSKNRKPMPSVQGTGIAKGSDLRGTGARNAKGGKAFL